MATKRIAQSAVNWSAMAEKVSESQRPMFNAFKLKSDQYLRRVMANPEKPPAIDWAYYQARVAVPGLVESFKKQYEALKVPYPVDKVTAQVDAQEKEAEIAIKEFIAQSNRRVAEAEAELKKWSSVLPFGQMTMEDFAEAFPEQAWNAAKPTYWPHDEASQQPPAKVEH
ncbi:hypothetical protein GHT06_014567 [Daphnia sinensis]|uniref:ATP synthase subunit d, mitochondrial n=1 Tax=Daphnia sinensis TaxID=1820382 RepID=A0AAD5PU19_9CRUS|nr:hypothetical protein GHT06_014567 [Daphnia sinensis]